MNNKFLEKFFIIEGIILLLLGILFFINPIESFFNITLLCGILIIITAISRFIRGFKSENNLYYFITAAIDLFFGLLVCLNPVAVVENLILLYGIWMFIKGLYNIIFTLKTKTFGINGTTILSIVSTLLGLFILLCPIVILLMLPWVPYFIGSYFILMAVTEFYIGYTLK